MSNVQVYHINCKVYLLKNIELYESLYEISNLINLGLGQDENMLNFHNSRRYKNYVHSGFNEIEKDKTYKEGRIYSFSIRCLDENLKDFFVKTLRDVNSTTMKGLVTTVKLIPKMYIEKLYSLNPLILKLSEGYWKENIDFLTFEKRLVDNAMKKAKVVLGKEFDEDFMLYNRIEFLNNKPISYKYKDISFLGDKVELYIANNEMAQTVAYILLGTGLLESNSLGFGFVNYKSIR